MLSSVTKIVDKSFVVGFVIPVLLGAVGILALLRDFGSIKPFYDDLIDTKSFANLTIIALLLWAVAILLLILNHLLYRILEGYSGPFSWIKSWENRRRTQYETDREKRRKTFEVISTVLNPTASAQEEIERATLGNDYYKEVRLFRASWPSEVDLVLPTRFGNVIRAFETYPLVNYGVDSIPGWVRLETIMPKDTRAMVDDARTEVDFFVNIWFFAVLFAVIGLFRCIEKAYFVWPDPYRMLTEAWGFALAAAIGALACWLAYEGAINRARSWGEVVKSVFDLYLPTLARKLGYELPATGEERRRFWDAVNSSFLYQTPINPEEWKAAKPANGAGKDKKGCAGDGDSPDGDDPTDDNDLADNDWLDDDDLANDDWL
jgi:hypothetical protein